MQTPLICPTIKKHNELGEKMQKKERRALGFPLFFCAGQGGKLMRARFSKKILMARFSVHRRLGVI